MFKTKNVCLIISVALAILCLIIMIVALGTGSQGLNSNDDVEVAGTALGMTIVMPCVVVGGIGTVLHTIGGCVYKRGLVLAGLILMRQWLILIMCIFMRWVTVLA